MTRRSFVAASALALAGCAGGGSSEPGATPAGNARGGSYPSDFITTLGQHIGYLGSNETCRTCN